MVDCKVIFLKKLNCSCKSHQHEGCKLGSNEPDVNQSQVGSWWKFLHYAEKLINNTFCSRIFAPTHLTNNVVATSITVRFTVTAASK